MQLDRATIVKLLVESLTAPRSAARRVIGVGGGLAVALLAVACAAVLSALISVLLGEFSPATGNADMDYLIRQPVLLAVLQALGMVVFGAVITAVGRLFGGTGRLQEVLLAFAWLDFLLLVVQMALLLVMLALPAVGGLLFLAAMGLVTWLIASFIAEVHGFKSTIATAAAVIGMVLLVGVGLVLISPPL